MTSDAHKKECLAIVFLPGRELARFPDQMARFDFLRRHYRVATVLSSAGTQVEGERETRVIAQKNPLLFSLRAAWQLLWKRRDYAFIYVIGLPAVTTFAFYRPACPIVAYAPTHFEQHYGPQRRRPFKLSAWLKLNAFLRGLARVNSVMAISRQLAALYTGRAPRVSLIPMGVDLSLYEACAPTAAADGGLNIIYPGSGGEGRGLDLIVDCARRLVAQGVPAVFHLVGCGDRLVERALAEEPALAQAIRVYPPMPYAEVVRMYGQMQVGVSLLAGNPFYSASPPQKIFEYMAAGLPVLCNELVTHTDYVGASALVIGWSADALFDGVCRMLANYPAFLAAAAVQRGQLDQYAHTTVERRFLEELESDLRHN